MKKAIIYTRYILPAALVLLIPLAAFLPCVSFELEMNPLEARSLVAVMRDAWEQCREYLADPMVTKDDATTAFVWRTMAGLLSAVVCAIASLGLSSWGTVRCLRIIGSAPTDPRAVDLRAGLRRILPGRGWLLAAQLLMLVPVMFPYWLAMTYSNTLYLSTTAHSLLTWLALGFAAISFLLVFFARGIEREQGLDAFDAAR